MIKIFFRFLTFHNYRIPRENLLNKHGDVLPDGTYKTQFKVISKFFIVYYK